MNEFTTYDISLRMKKLGYDEPCLAVYRGGSLYGSGTSVSRYYDEGHWELERNSNYGGDIEQWVAAPTLQSAFKWFREKYQIHHRIDIQDLSENLYDYEILEVLDGFNDLHSGSSFKSYEEAQIACLEKVIKIAERK
jgi:hypothetical protein